MRAELKQIQERILENKKNHGFNTTDIKFEMLLLYTEISELFQAHMKNDHANMAEELADIAIYALGIAEMLDIDLGEEILKKMAINEKRIYHEDGTKSLLEK